MTRSLFTLLLFGLIAPGAQASEQLFGLLDKNKDGQLAADEIGAQHQRLFERLLRKADQDQDGQLSSSEFTSGLQSQTAPKPLVEKQGSEMLGINAVLLLLAKMDANSDGRIVEKEVPPPFRKVYQEIEARAGGKPDGVLDRRELAKAATLLSRVAVKIAKQMDLDVDVEVALLSNKQWQSVQRMLGEGPKLPQGKLTDPLVMLKYIRSLDGNQDGKITLDEVPARVPERVKKLLKQADRNSDKQLSKRELSALSQQMQARAAGEKVARLTPAQKKQALRRLLKKFDKNRDGKISRGEAPPQLAKRFQRIDTDGNGQLNRKELVQVVEFIHRQKKSAAKPSEKPRPSAS